MAEVRDWANTAAGNDRNPPGPPDYPSENQNRASLNNTMRENMAAVRRLTEDGSWFDWGQTYAYVSGTQFQVQNGDFTATYSAKRAVRAVGPTTGTITGSIQSSSFSSPHTEVTVVWDSGTLQNEPLEIFVGPEPEAVRTNTLGTAAAKDFGTGVGQLVELENVNGNPGLPAVDGTQLTGLSMLLEEQVASSDTLLLFNTAANFQNYKHVWFEYEGVMPSVNSVNFRIELSSDGGSSWILGQINEVGWGKFENGVNIDLFATGESDIGLAGFVGNVTGFVSGNTHFYGLQADVRMRAHSNIVWRRDDLAGLGGNNIWSELASTVEINAMRFFFSSGLIASGTIRMYGRN